MPSLRGFENFTFSVDYLLYNAVVSADEIRYNGGQATEVILLTVLAHCQRQHGRHSWYYYLPRHDKGRAE